MATAKDKKEDTKNGVPPISSPDEEKAAADKLAAEQAAAEEKAAADKLAAEQAAANEKETMLKFIVPKFNYNGIEYKAEDLEAAAAAGDVAALKVIQELVDIKSGVIQIVTE